MQYFRIDNEIETGSSIYYCKRNKKQSGTVYIGVFASPSVSKRPS